MREPCSLVLLFPKILPPDCLQIHYAPLFKAIQKCLNPQLWQHVYIIGNDQKTVATQNNTHFPHLDLFFESIDCQTSLFYLLSIGTIQRLQEICTRIHLVGHSHFILSHISEEWTHFSRFKYKIATDYWITDIASEKVFFSKTWGIPPTRILKPLPWQKKLCASQNMDLTHSFHIGLNHYFDGKFEWACSALKHHSDNRSKLICGFALLKLNRSVEASIYFDEAAKSKSYKSDSHLGLALSQFSTGNLHRGIAYLQKAVALQPYHMEAMQALSHVSNRKTSDTVIENKIILPDMHPE